MEKAKKRTKKAFVILLLIMVVGSICGTAEAKSVYAITDHESGTLKAYQIHGNQLGPPYAQATIEGSAIDVTVDSQLKLLFLTFEGGGIVCADANTLAQKGSLATPPMAGIVADEAKQKVYAVERETNQLYVCKWDGNELVLIDIVTLANLGGQGGLGIALDKMARRLYVANDTNTVHYYDVDDPNWAHLGSRNVGHATMDIDVDSSHGYLYVGGYQEGTSGYTYLVKHNLRADANPNTEQDIGTADIGLAVDPVSGLVYVTTYSKEIRVYDCSSYPFVQTYSVGTNGTSWPAGICVESAGGWVKLTKIDDVNDGDCVWPGREITYTIDYNYYAGPNYPDINDVNIIDHLPDEVEFVSSVPVPNEIIDSNKIVWHIGTLSPGESGFVTLKVKVKKGVGGGTIWNCCETTWDRMTSSVTAYEYTSICRTVKLDFNNTANNTDAATEKGFTKFIIPDSGREVNGVVIDLAGDLSSKRQSSPWYIPADSNHEQIYRDFIFGITPTSGITITLWGLVADRDCDITIYSFDDQSTPNRIADWTANGEYLFTTDFKGGSANWPFSTKHPGDYAWTATAHTDYLGEIVLKSWRDPNSYANQPYAYVNALVVEPKGFAPTRYAHRPVPFDGNEGVPVNGVLKWRNGDGVVKQDLYLGTDEDAVADATRTSHPGVRIYAPDLGVDANAGYDPYGATGFLKLDQPYYWRVDENDNPSLYPSLEVWSFRTCPNSVEENFNSYSTTAALKAVWNDYWVNGTTAEVFVIADPNRGGPPHQSMEYDFKNNSYEPYYAEATATIGTGAGKLNVDPNWLGMGAKSLVLYFYGQITNPVSEQMYIKLTDSGTPVRTAKVFYDGSPNDLRQATWHEWNIALQEFTDNNNVNLAKVAKITIGFGDGTQAASDGIVYFEDIQLYAPRCVLSKRSGSFAKVDYAPPGNPSGDCVINFREFGMMADDWLMTPPPDPNIDLYGDGKIDHRDLAVLAEMWLEEELWPY